MRLPRLVDYVVVIAAGIGIEGAAEVLACRHTELLLSSMAVGPAVLQPDIVRDGVLHVQLFCVGDS